MFKKKHNKKAEKAACCSKKTENILSFALVLIEAVRLIWDVISCGNG